MKYSKRFTGAAIAVAAVMVPLASVHAQGSGMDGGEPIDIVNAWNYDSLYENGFSAEEFMDAEVYDDGEEIGEVEDLVLTPGEGVTGMIIETGGFLDIGDTHLLYPFDEARDISLDEVEVSIDVNAIEDYSLFPTVEGESLEGQKMRVTQLIGDYAYLEGGVPYGLVDDMVISRTGDVLAVVVQPDVSVGYGGYYAWPYYGVEPGLGYYEVPYTMEEVGTLEPFDYGALQGEPGDM